MPLLPLIIISFSEGGGVGGSWETYLMVLPDPEIIDLFTTSVDVVLERLSVWGLYSLAFVSSIEPSNPFPTRFPFYRNAFRSTQDYLVQTLLARIGVNPPRL